MIMESKSKKIPDGRIRPDFIKPYFAELTVANAKVGGNLSDFPVLISEDNMPSILWKHCLAAGGDIEFYSSEGVKLSREIVSITPATPVMEAWAASDLLGASDTKIWIRYHNANGSETNDTSTWDANFVMVYHMNDLTNVACADSTSNGFTVDKVAANQPIEAVGKIGKGQDFDGGDDYMDKVHDVAMDSDILTLECWIKATDAQAGADHHVLHKNLPARLCYDEDDATVKGGFTIRDDAHNWYDSGGDVISNGVWHYFCGRYDGSSVLDTWLDDAVGATNTIGDVTPLDPNTANFTVGSKDAGNGGFFKGLIDEVRYSTSHRSDNWMLTCYNTQNDPSTFYSVIDRRWM